MPTWDMWTNQTKWWTVQKLPRQLESWKKKAFPPHRHGHPRCIWHTIFSRRFLFMIWSTNYMKQMCQVVAMLGSFYITNLSPN
jgi:hypothetical protein